jgi:hypothetical protein
MKQSNSQANRGVSGIRLFPLLPGGYRGDLRSLTGIWRRFAEIQAILTPKFRRCRMAGNHRTSLMDSSCPFYVDDIDYRQCIRAGGCSLRFVTEMKDPRRPWRGRSTT